jgi:mannose/cellobiose epimerase-like protein (N-acyl-D-glucosamine 2-epimerase family)
MTPHELVHWMRATALPFWSSDGWNAADGLFHESLLASGAPDRTAILRVRVQFRQIYCFSHAHDLGWFPSGADLALSGFAGLQKHFWDRGGGPGYVHHLHPDLSIANAKRDSYDHAFAVLALSWLWHVSGDVTVRRQLVATLDYVDAMLTAPDGSLIEGVPASLPRRQNPQMHWFEAMLALAAHGFPGADARLANAHAHFLRMTKQGSAPVREYFDDHWQPAAGEEGQIIEPGHLAEWVWLLRQYQRLTGKDQSSATTMLLEAAGRFHKNGRLVDEALFDGTVRKPSSRSWLATEWAKAWIAESEFGRDGAEAMARAALADMAGWHLGRPFPAGWVDQVDAAGRDISGPIPASILYHVFVAVAEADRGLNRAA